MNSGSRMAAVGQIARSVQNIGESEQWYRDTLGLEHLYTFDRFAFFDCGGTRLMLSQGEHVNDAESLIYFKVADIESAYHELRERGIEFVDAPHMIHKHEDGVEEWMAFFNDPEGRLLAIMAAVHP